MTTRLAISSYLRTHPDATVREIQRACGISSPSVVQYHLVRLPLRRHKTVCCPMCHGVGRVPESEVDG